MNWIISILIIVTGNILVDKLIIQPVKRWNKREAQRLQRLKNLDDYIEHHKVK